MNDVVHNRYDRLQAYKNTFANEEHWNEFVGKLGLFELQNITNDVWISLLNSPKYKTFNTLYKQDKTKVDMLDFYWNVIPIGAGSSYIGALQKYLLYNKEVPTNEMKYNLWDNEYGTMMTRNKPQDEKLIVVAEDSQVNLDKVIKTEDDLLKVFGRDETWYTLFENYYSILTGTMSANTKQYQTAENIFVEITVHHFPILFDLFGNSKINLFIDCSWERFKWCFLIATIKHKSHLKNLKQQCQDTAIIYNLATQCKQAWEIYKIVKQYYNPMLSINYESLFIHQDEDVIKILANETLQRKATDRQLDYLGKHLNMYTNRNNKIMESIPLDVWEKFIK